MRPLKTTHHYLRVALDPPCADALTVRKALQDALQQSFGLTAANTYVDVLWVAEDRRAAVVRLAARCARAAYFNIFSPSPELCSQKFPPCLF